jgi:uncharacterized membrane protein
LAGLDALRGIVMILMALDHVRDFFHAGAMTYSPTDLTRSTPILFFTRWITHFCLPVFMFAAGAGAFLWWRQRARTKAELSRFLWTRGLWLGVLELTVMRFAYNFNFSLRFPVFLLILWIFGICMIAVAALIYLSRTWLLSLSIAVILLHNCLDPINANQFGPAAWVWNLLHQPGVFMAAGVPVLVSYTFVPWVAVLAAGFCFGQVLVMETSRRSRIMLRLGLSCVVGFLIIRSINSYGDPVPWSHQKSATFTVLSFLNCTKYPASLEFLLMTLGPALLVLAYLDRLSFRSRNPLLIFGRVPLFYFVLHFYAIHALVVAMSWLRYGSKTLNFMFTPVPSMGGSPKIFPSNFGYDLWVVYVVWIALVMALYPVCRWFAGVKSTRREWWVSYL